MQTDKAARLRKAWAAKGNPPCGHSTQVKEYHLGADTGDLVCTTCGEAWAQDDPERPGTSRYPAKTPEQEVEPERERGD